jgi:hypothetical protein
MIPKIRIGRRVFIGLAALVAFGINQANAATVTVIHGINGLDLNTARELPVDIAVNGACALKGVKFTQSTAVELGKGTYSITVHPADGKCGAASVIKESLVIDDKNSFASLSAVASLSASGKPQLLLFNNSQDLGFPSTLAVRHAAFAAPVFAKFDVAGYRNSPAVRISNGKISAIFSALDSRLSYNISVLATRRSGTLARLRGSIRTPRQIWRVFYVVGSARNGLAIVKQDVARDDLK